MTDTAVSNSCAILGFGNTSAQTQREPLLFGSAALEDGIRAAYDRLAAATTRADKLVHWREMVRLIDQRTPEQVARLEAQRGLKT